MSSDWWAKKLGGGAPARTYNPPAGPSYPQTPQRAYIPPMPQASPNVQVTKDNLMEAAGQWQGGKATKTETGRCPDCGGDKYFSMSNGESLGGAGARIATERGMASTSPRCFECGYSLARPKQTGSM